MSQIEQARAAVESHRLALEAAEAKLRELESTPDGAALLDAMLPLSSQEARIHASDGKHIFTVCVYGLTHKQDSALAAEIVRRLNNYNQMKATLEKVHSGFSCPVLIAAESLRKLKEGGS